MGLLADVDAVTIDAMGTLVRLDAPVERLAALAGVGIEEARRGFEAEVAFYLPRAVGGRDDASLAELRAECAAVFDAHAGASLDAADFMAGIVFEPETGAFETVRRLQARGLALCVVSNWDVGLAEHLERLGLRVPVVTSAAVGVAKPDPAVFRAALDLLGVDPARALHCGDSHSDEAGALAAGMRFAPAPLEGLL